MPTGKFELFISYSRKDNVPQKPGDAKGWVTALRDEILADHRRFSTEPLRIFFDTQAIASMDDWRHRILEGLRHSRILLVCLSPDYFRSEYCRMEWEEYLKRQVHALMGHDSIAPVYFVEAPGSDEQVNATDFAKWIAEIKPWLDGVMRPNFTDLRPWFPHGIEALREAAVREKVAALGTSLWERIQRARRATGVPGNLRRLNPHFIGRRTELRQLHENLALGAVGVVTAVHGLGGQGKTELATAYAHGWADSYPAGLWVLGAEGKKELLPLLGELCAELQIPLTTGPDETADARGRRVLAELKRRASDAAPRDPDKGAACLVILDNASEPALLAEPQLARIPREDWLRVVVTTREGPEKFPVSRQKSLAFIAVDALTEDDAARLIEDQQPDAQWPTATAAVDAAAAREIARELGGFTLAVESVAIYLGLHPDIRPADYLARLRAEGLTGVDALPADADVAAQMQHREKQLRLVLDQTLARLTPPERTALDYAALLPPDSIPWPWLRALVEKDHTDEFAAGPGYPDPWPALRRRLEGLRLLTPGDHIEIARLHRMVTAHILWANQHANVSLPTRAVQIAPRFETSAVSFLKTRADFLWENWEEPGIQWELSPFMAFAWHWSQNKNAEWAFFANAAARILHGLGRFEESENLYRRIFQSINDGARTLRLHLATFCNNFAALLADTNRLPEAERLAQEALSIYEERGENSADSARCMATLAGVFTATNRTREAERLLRKAISIVEGQATDRRSYCAYLGELGVLLQQTRRISEALQVKRQALEIAEQLHGPTHLSVAIRLNNLAMTLQYADEVEEAEPLVRRELQIFKHCLGPKHPSVAASLSILGNLLKAKGDLEEAEATLREALAIDEQSHGPNHPNVARDLGNLARLLMESNRLGEAEPLMRRHVVIILEFKQTTGHEHPFTRAALLGYEMLLNKMGLTQQQVMNKLSELPQG